MRASPLPRRPDWPFVLGLVLALAVLAAIATRLAARSHVVEIDKADWRCEASHDEKIAVPRPPDGVEFRTDVVCDRWVRR